MSKLTALTFALLTATACGGGGLVSTASQHADQACACADYDCAKKAVAAMNKVSFQSEDEKKALGEADKKTYMGHIDRMSKCRDALKK